MSSKRLPGLDGLRALSIALVVVGHAYQGATQAVPSSPLWLISGNSALGVEIFFVISGFLITTLLLEEYEERGNFSLRNFYMRRVFRIVPALWVYLAAILLLSAWGVLGGVTRGAYISALTFTTDYSPWADSAALTHTWSLSVEEQFYLLWPVALGLVLKRSGRSAAARLALLLVLLAPVSRVLTYVSGNQFLATHLYFMLHTRMDALMFGCWLALVNGTATFERFYGTARHWVVPAALFTLFVSPLVAARYGGSYIYTAGYSIEGGSIALALLWLVRNSASPIGRIFNARPVVHVGVVSYSLYLWQELLLKSGLTLSHYALIAIPCSLAAAELSYLFVERPCLRARRRFVSREQRD